jgi:glutathione S-transferase
MKLYGSKNSRSLRCAWALEEACASYEYERIWMMKGQGQSPEFKAVNPAGKIPVLTDGGVNLTESGAIIFYIADQFPDAHLWPSDPLARAEAYRWFFYAITEVEPHLWAIAQHRFALPEDKRIAALEPTSMWQLARSIRPIEKFLGQREFIAGDAFTAADIVTTHCLTWALSAKLEGPGDACLAYIGRMKQRAAYQAAMARETMEAERQEAALAAAGDSSAA